jgi:hypothetical protein
MPKRMHWQSPPTPKLNAANSPNNETTALTLPGRPPFHNQKGNLFFPMTSLSHGSAPVNTAGQRELLIHALRTAASRSRLTTNVLETVSVQLRHRQITCDEAIAWLRAEGVLDLVQYKAVLK